MSAYNSPLITLKTAVVTIFVVVLVDVAQYKCGCCYWRCQNFIYTTYVDIVAIERERDYRGYL